MSGNGDRTWSSDPSAHQEEIRSYHRQPVIKEPVWTWEIPCYFFTGGLAGASAGLAYLSELRGEEVLARRTWAAATVGVAASPMLLISDLGRPARFLNMFRMFKVTSPMSVGSWILAGSSAATTVAAANSWLGMFPRLARVMRPAAALLGLPLSTYTAALVTNTSVPAWHEARRMLPLVFGAGACLSAGAGGVISTPPPHAAAARRLAVAGAAAELAFNEIMHRRLGQQGEAYKRKPAGTFGHLARGVLVAGTALLLTRGSKSRGGAAAAGSLLLGGALSARWSVFKAGFTSVSDPKYVIGPQRERIEQSQSAGSMAKDPVR